MQPKDTRDGCFRVKSNNDAFFLNAARQKASLSLFFESTLEDQNDNCVRRELLRSFTLQKSLLERASARIINMWCKDVCFVPFTPFSSFPSFSRKKKNQKERKKKCPKIFEKYRDAWSPKKGPNLVLWCSVLYDKRSGCSLLLRVKRALFFPHNNTERRAHTDRYTHAYIYIESSWCYQSSPLRLPAPGSKPFWIKPF